MKRWISVILTVCAVTAAAFAWQVGVLAMADDMDGHAMGIECLAHCLTAGADEADVAATISVVVSVVLAVAVVSFLSVLAPLASGERTPARARPFWDPNRHFLTVRRE